jgi:serine/threonine protein kinase
MLLRKRRSSSTWLCRCASLYAPRSKYVFRDLKPENVMIDRFGYPVVIDFGFAKYVPEHTHCVVVNAVSLALCVAVKLAIEELVSNTRYPLLSQSACLSSAGGCHVPWSQLFADHWSLGIIIYEMITESRFTMKEWIKCLSTRALWRMTEPPVNTAAS